MSEHSLFQPQATVISLPQMIVGPYENHWKEDLDPALYHADRGALSSTGLRKLIKSPAKFKSYWQGELSDEVTDAMHFGTLAHTAILEPKRFMEGYQLIPEFWGYTAKGERTTSRNCKEVKDKEAMFYATLPKGTIAVEQEEYNNLTGMMGAILDHKDACVALTNGKPELSGWYVDKETGLLCRIRPDFLHFNGRTLVDVKTTKDCEAFSFARDIYSHGYHIQLAMYAAGCEAITGVKVKFPTIIAIEKQPPFEVAVYVLDDAAMDLGEAMYRRGLRRLKEALTTGVWPKYQSQAQNISLPGYAYWDDSLAS